MKQLNFPKYNFRFKNSENKQSIFDDIRKKFVILNPEEWVRQNCIKFLIHEKHYPKSLINVEKEIIINNTKKRYDIVVYKPNGSIQILIECKAPKIKITQNTFDQIARYNLTLKANLLMVTNGFDHYYCHMDYINERYVFLKDIPNYVS